MPEVIVLSILNLLKSVMFVDSLFLVFILTAGIPHLIVFLSPNLSIHSERVCKKFDFSKYLFLSFKYNLAFF